MQHVTVSIPVSKLPALATAAILDGGDLGAWLVESIQNETFSPATEEADVPVVLDSLAETQPETAAVPDSDFFADII